MAIPTRYLTIDELVYINEQIIPRSTVHTIVDGKRKVRDMGLLESAVGRPMQTVFGEDAYATNQEKAAALLHSLVRNHPFADGNKRTATAAALFMLAVNGLWVKWNADEALHHIVQMAEGRMDVPEFAAWLATEPCPPRPEQDTEADMGTIADIITEQRWLLDELAKQ
jgi:death-on-curing protein